MDLEVLLQLEHLVEGLPAHLAHWGHFAGVLSHVVQQIFLLAKDESADVTLVLDLPGVNGHVLLEAVESAELPLADVAHEETGSVLLGLHGIMNLGHVVCWNQNNHVNNVNGNCQDCFNVP